MVTVSPLPGESGLAAQGGGLPEVVLGGISGSRNAGSVFSGWKHRYGIHTVMPAGSAWRKQQQLNRDWNTGGSGASAADHADAEPGSRSDGVADSREICV